MGSMRITDVLARVPPRYRAVGSELPNVAQGLNTAV
jgi:hypothetical protein